MPVALAAVQAQLALPQAHRGDDDEISAEVMRASVLLAPHLDAPKRADWVSGVQAEFMCEPFDLVVEGIALARRSCTDPRQFVPAVIAHVIARKARIEAQRERYEAMLAAIS